MKASATVTKLKRPDLLRLDFMQIRFPGEKQYKFVSRDRE